MGDDELTSTTTATMARTAAAPANMRMTTAGDHGADAGNDVDDDDVHPSMKHVIAVLVTRSMRKSARIDAQEDCQTDRRARRCAHVARVVFGARDSCPGRMVGVSRVHCAVTLSLIHI